jgi:hypothetical protein
MVLWPYLIKSGWLPYCDIAIAHTPFLIAILTIYYKLFGVGILQLKIFTWCLIIGLDLLVFGIVKKLWNEKFALITVAAFAFWQLFFDGNGLWFDLFMGVFTLSSYYFIRQKKYFWVGIFWALAFISKQTAVWFLIPIGLTLTNKDLKPLFEFIKGTILILIIFVLSLWAFGMLPAFYQWAIHFGIFILPNAEGQIQFPDLKPLAVSTFPFLIFIPLIWKNAKKNLNLLLWAFAGCLGAYPRFEYFHFQASLPFLAIAISLVLTDMKKIGRLWKILITIYLIGSVFLFADYWIKNWGEGTRFYEQDVADVVSFVNYSTKSGDRIFVLNWWDNIYALTDTLPSTDPWMPQLSWYMDLPGIQDKIVKDLSVSPPKLIVYYPYTDSGLSSYIPQKVYDYITKNYRLSQKVDDLEILIPNK